MNCSEISYLCNGKCIGLHEICQVNPAAVGGEERLSKVKALISRLAKGEPDPRKSRKKPNCTALVRLQETIPQ